MERNSAEPIREKDEGETGGDMETLVLDTGKAIVYSVNHAVRKDAELSEALVLNDDVKAKMDEKERDLEINPDKVTYYGYCSAIAYNAFLGDDGLPSLIVADEVILINAIADGAYLLDVNDLNVTNMSGVFFETIGNWDVNYKVKFTVSDEEWTAVIGNENDNWKVLELPDNSKDRGWDRYDMDEEPDGQNPNP